MRWATPPRLFAASGLVTCAASSPLSFRFCRSASSRSSLSEVNRTPLKARVLRVWMTLKRPQPKNSPVSPRPGPPRVTHSTTL